MRRRRPTELLELPSLIGPELMDVQSAVITSLKPWRTVTDMWVSVSNRISCLYQVCGGPSDSSRWCPCSTLKWKQSWWGVAVSWYFSTRTKNPDDLAVDSTGAGPPSAAGTWSRGFLSDVISVPDGSRGVLVHSSIQHCFSGWRSFFGCSPLRGFLKFYHNISFRFKFGLWLEHSRTSVLFFVILM